MHFHLSQIDSPIGGMLLVTDAQQIIRALDFADHASHLHRNLRAQYDQYRLIDAPAPQMILDAMARYFSGELHALDTLPTATHGTPRQEQVWQALRHIPAGTTTTYGKLAKALGYDAPRAAIAIGAANGANPVAIIVPCHRVVASDGGLKGYAWGLHRKRWLLAHEKALCAQQAAPHTATLPEF